MGAEADTDAAPSHRFALDKTFTYRLHVLHKLTDKQSQNAYLAETGLALSEGRCLAAVGAFGPLSVVELGKRANLDKGQASRAAQTLVAKDLVSKDAHPVDGRGVMLALTERGGLAWQRVSALIERRNDQILACLSDDELTRFNGLLDRLIAQVEQAAKAQ